VLIEEFSDDEYVQAARGIEEMARQPEARKNARFVAEQLFDLNNGAARYAALYEKTLGQD